MNTSTWSTPIRAGMLINAVYEPTFTHLGDEFGKTILGFFTDEPGFMNEKGATLEDASTSSFIGRGDMALPWSDELARRLHEALGTNWLSELRGLWTRDPGRRSGPPHLHGHRHATLPCVL